MLHQLLLQTQQLSSAAILPVILLKDSHGMKMLTKWAQKVIGKDYSISTKYIKFQLLFILQRCWLRLSTGKASDM